MRGRRQDQPGDAPPAGGLQQVVRPEGVGPQHLAGIRLLALPAQVDDRVDVPAGGRDRVRVGERAEHHLLGAGALDPGRADHVEQPQHAPVGDQAGPQGRGDLARPAGDQDAHRNPPLCRWAPSVTDILVRK